MKTSSETNAPIPIDPKTKIYIIIPIWNFSTKKEYSMEELDLKIIPGWTKVNSLPQQFKLDLGIDLLRKIYNTFWLYFEGPLDKLMEERPVYTAEDIHNTVRFFTTSFVNNLWFAKDNAAYTSFFIIHFDRPLLSEQDIVTHINQRTGINTMFDGKGKIVDFTEDELNYTLNITQFVLTHKAIPASVMPLIQADKSLYTTISTNVAIYDHSRIKRALKFLDYVRADFQMIMKITFHMAIYECLFTGNNIDTGRKIRERLSLILEGSDDEILANNRLLNKCYDIRSKIIHGSINSTPISEYRVLSQQLDNISRKVLAGIILDDNPNLIYNLSDTKKDRRRFEDAFDNLTNKATKPHGIFTRFKHFVLTFKYVWGRAMENL